MSVSKECVCYSLLSETGGKNSPEESFKTLNGGGGRGRDLSGDCVGTRGGKELSRGLHLTERNENTHLLLILKIDKNLEISYLLYLLVKAPILNILKSSLNFVIFYVILQICSCFGYVLVNISFTCNCYM